MKGITIKWFSQSSKFRVFAALSGLFCLYLASNQALADGWFSFSSDKKKQETMSVNQAKSLIASGTDLELIPKSTWKTLLPEDQYDILWKEGTERPFTGKWLKESRSGVFVSAGCRIPVFKSDHKFTSGTGWPSFWDVYNSDNVVLKTDYSWGMKRTEVLSKCGEHLGHVFDDGPAPTGLRYCINSLALDFVPDVK